MMQRRIVPVVIAACVGVVMLAFSLRHDVEPDAEWVPCWTSPDGMVVVSVGAAESHKCEAGEFGPIVQRGTELRWEYVAQPCYTCMTGPGGVAWCIGCDADCDGDVDLKDWSEVTP